MAMANYKLTVFSIIVVDNKIGYLWITIKIIALVLSTVNFILIMKFRK